jgi:hypothetical protein
MTTGRLILSRQTVVHQQMYRPSDSNKDVGMLFSTQNQRVKTGYPKYIEGYLCPILYIW